VVEPGDAARVRRADRARQDIDAVLGRGVDAPYALLEDPPTFDELRADGEPVEPVSWVPDASVESHPRGRDPEDQLGLDHSLSERGVSSTTAVAALWLVPVVTLVLLSLVGV